MQKIYDVGSQRLDDELDMVKIIQIMRNLKVLLKDKIISKDLKNKIKSSNKNIINLEENE